jgi:hypothetical protein
MKFYKIFFYAFDPTRKDNPSLLYWKFFESDRTIADLCSFVVQRFPDWEVVAIMEMMGRDVAHEWKPKS